jgi:hypothetical protein
MPEHQMNRLLLTPELAARLVELLTPEEDKELLEYAASNGTDDYPYRATEWLMRRFNLTLGQLRGVPEDALLIVRRILPVEHD